MRTMILVGVAFCGLALAACGSSETKTDGGIDMRVTDMRHADMHEADMSHVDMAHAADMSHVDMHEVDMSQTD